MKKILTGAFMKFGKVVTSKIGYTIVRTVFILSTVQLMLVAILTGNILAFFEGAVVLVLFGFLILKDGLIANYSKLVDSYAKDTGEMLKTLKTCGNMIKKSEKRSAARLGSIRNLEIKRAECEATHKKNAKPTTKAKKEI